MPTGEPLDTQAAEQQVERYSRRTSGKLIRRQIERRFDAVLSEIARRDPAIIRQTTFARWILDNSHLVRQALQHVETDLPSAFHRQLPTVDDINGHEVVRIFELVNSAIEHSGLPIDCAAIENFFSQYQSTNDPSTRLTIGELWAIPIALRVILLTRLCAAAELRLKDPSEGVGSAADDGDATEVAGCVSSLRTAGTFNWIAFVDQISVVERCLRSDPSEIYRRMDFSTRDRYRDAVELIAKRAGGDQWDVASAALHLAEQAVSTKADPHRQHIGYYLIDEGRKQLERAVNYRPSILEILKRRVRQHRSGLYVFAIAAPALFGSVALILALMDDQVKPYIAVAAGCIALIPLLSITGGAINFLVSLIVPPRRLPKLDFTVGIPADHFTIVVVPMLLSSAEEIAENLKTLELNYLGNSDVHLRFALLSDFTDANHAEIPADQQLLTQAVSGITDLNRKYASNNIRPFLLFHRRRDWNDNAKCWMGWERKRGKLEEFNELLRGATDTSYVLHHGVEDIDFNRIKYVITLDADSYMPTGTAARLSGTLAHPLNRPRFDDKTNCVVGGYTVLQPRLETNPVDATNTLFAKLYAGDVTLDLYTNAVSDVYQDLFGDAVFAGKGIYDLDAFRRSVGGEIPVNSVLSHDLLEGLFGRAGLVSDIVLLENYPPNYLVYLRRLHRWIRGDWQLLPWLLGSNVNATLRFNPGLVGYWKLFDNLRRSLVIPAILMLLILGWLTLAVNPVAWTILFALLPGLPILLRVTLALRTSLWRWGTIESSFRNLIDHAGTDAARWLLALVFLPVEAYVVVDAVCRTIYRTVISRQRLLEWSTAAHVSRSIGKDHTALGFYRHLWFGPGVALVACPAILALNPHALIAASPLLVLWLCSPLIALGLNHHIAARPPLRLPDSDSLLVRGIAHDTWRFFERFVGPETCWLPPDNVQEYPKRIIAERTSPTNIGMMLLSTLTAYDLGYLGQRQLLTRLQNHLESVQRMEKHRGHLFNWYSTNDRQPLQPHYVSTVDSGNFVAALIILRQTLEELSGDPRPIDRAVLGLTDELTALRRQLFTTESKQTDSTTLALLSSFEAAHAVLSDTEDTEDPVAAVHQFEHQYCGEIDHAFLCALEQNPTRWSVEEIANFRENSQVFRQRVRIILEDIELYSPWSEKLLAPPATLLAAENNHYLARLSATLTKLNDVDDFDDRSLVASELITEILNELATSIQDDQLKEAQAWLVTLQNGIESTCGRMHRLEQSRQSLIGVATGLIEKNRFPVFI